MHKITTLENGLRIVTQNMPGLETVSMGIWNFVGGRDETKDINGVAHLLEHMAFKGTSTKNALQIAETIENVGGDINAYTSKEITAYYVKLLADDLHYGIDILTDILQNSTFAEDELNRERGVIIQEIGMYLDTPDDMIFDYWQEKAYPDQPMGRSILGKTDIIKNISKIEVDAFKKMISTAVEAFPNFKVTATTLRAVQSATVNDWGAICWSDGDFFEATNQKGLEILDRVGGGDSFASGLIYGFLATGDPQQAVEYGAAHGALAMTTPGDTSMATLAEVEQLIGGGGARVQR